MDDDLDQHVENRINCGYGDILDELNALDCQEPSAFDEPWDHLLAQQELEDFEQADEYFGFYGGDEW